MTAGLEQALHERTLLLDGAFATAIDLPVEQVRTGYESLVLTRPDAVGTLHARYIAAGADIITTNTFLADCSLLARYGLERRSFDIAVHAAEIACDAVAQSGRKCFVFGSLHPVDSESHTHQIEGLLAGGVDALLLETICDTAPLTDIIRAIRRRSSWIPIIASATTTHLPDAEEFYRALPADEFLAVGYNCSCGAESIARQAEWLGANARCATIFYPNTGAKGASPAEFAAVMERYLQQRLCNIAGGCCGTTPEHTAALRTKIDGYATRLF